MKFENHLNFNYWRDFPPRLGGCGEDRHATVVVRDDADGDDGTRAV